MTQPQINRPKELPPLVDYAKALEEALQSEDHADRRRAERRQNQMTITIKWTSAGAPGVI